VPEQVLKISPPVIPADLPSELLERRPDIASVERHMAAANAGIGVAKGAFFPTIRLNGLAGFESVSASSLFDWESHLWSIGPSLTLPIFQGGELRARLRLAKADYDETVANYRQTVLAAFAEVEDNLSAQNLLASQYDEQVNALRAANRQLEIANERYRDGLVTYLEVATAQNNSLGLERTTIQLRGQQFVAAVALVKALGGGWQQTVNHEGGKFSATAQVPASR
jgi:multidrug efflux system outer membrane protein